MIQLNKYLGWGLFVMNNVTLLCFFIFIRYVFWPELFLPIICVPLLTFMISGFAATRDRTQNSQSIKTALGVGRFLVLVAMITPFIADMKSLYISTLGGATLALSWYFDSKKELQLLILNSIGVLFCGSIALTGLNGLIESLG